MTLSPRARRLIAYPLSVAVAVSVWFYGFGEVEADVETLVSAASVRAEMAQQIDAGSPDGAALRARLLAEAENLAARAAAVEPEAALVLETKAFLALLDGQAVEAARLYGAARGAGDCDSVHRDLLVAAEAKAWSNAGQVERALRVLDGSEEPADESVALDRETLRIRLYARSGQQDAAVAHTLSLWAKPWADASAAALELIGAMGAGDLAASAARNAQWQRALQDYFLARLKLQSGDTDTAGSLLERSLETGDQEVTRHFQRDRDLWVTGIGTERIDRFMTPRAELATPPGAR
jgi:tetratricopeptide (TPR) repeat protein